MGIFDPLHNLAADALAVFCRSNAGHAEFGLRVVGRVGRGQAQTAAGNLTQSPPAPMHHPEDGTHNLLGRTIAVTRDGPRVLVFDFSPPFLQLFDAQVDPVQNVQGLKAGDDNRHIVFGRDGFVFGVAHNGADMARGQKALHLTIGRRKQGFHRRGDQHVGGQN